MYPMTEKEILEYIESEEPMDKAGGYAIQGKGAVFIKKVEGEYNTVASSSPFGFPKICPSNATTVSAPIIRQSSFNSRSKISNAFCLDRSSVFFNSTNTID